MPVDHKFRAFLLQFACLYQKQVQTVPTTTQQQQQQQRKAERLP